MYLSKPPPSCSRQHQLPRPAEKETGEAIGDNYGWLVLAKENIRRELEGSKMELELVRDLLSELEVGSKIRRSNLGARDQVFLMRACQEYSGSRSCMLEERLRQIDLWLGDVRIGRDVPHRVPDEYVAPNEIILIEISPVDDYINENIFFFQVTFFLFLFTSCDLNIYIY
ncbi:hypothetical protein F4813DRAFT_371659 [Daldinia decipiens]|uniref:uncharacterized protein n=1 Tax=Daldinia decipiens TaxID=326647 RepID=UPI0020C37A80|nr:uncharacterized protein F4813DRAFT_371659 [Daldinia decipiens]KAI1654149.1 hypothetical protein F4813DRAFT_371659 [Daldinia decipiens]